MLCLTELRTELHSVWILVYLLGRYIWSTYYLSGPEPTAEEPVTVSCSVGPG